MIMKFLSMLIFLLTPSSLIAQTSLGYKDGCLNIIDLGTGPGIGQYGDKCIFTDYTHESVVNEHFTFGIGIGYNNHVKYKLTTLPIFLSARYFFLDSQFSPFVNLKFGGFGILRKKNVNTNEIYSLSTKNLPFNLFISPAVGIKLHITHKFGVMTSISDDMYLLKAYDVDKSNYTNKLISNLNFNIGVFFQIDGW